MPCTISRRDSSSRRYLHGSLGLRDGRAGISQTKPTGSQSRVFAKQLREGALVAETEVDRHLGKGLIGVEQPVTGGLNARLHEEFLDAQAEHFPKLAMQLAWR